MEARIGNTDKLRVARQYIGQNKLFFPSFFPSKEKHKYKPIKKNTVRTGM
jgi:hypothetical protein